MYEVGMEVGLNTIGEKEGLNVAGLVVGLKVGVKLGTIGSILELVASTGRTM